MGRENKEDVFELEGAYIRLGHQRQNSNVIGNMTKNTDQAKAQLRETELANRSSLYAECSVQAQRVPSSLN